MRDPKNDKKLIKIEKIMAPPQNKENENSKSKSQNITKSPFLITQKVPCILLCCYYSSQMICKTEGGAPL